MAPTKDRWIYAKIDSGGGRAHATCPTCASKFRVLEQHHKKTVKCPKCSCPFQVLIEVEEPEVAPKPPPPPTPRLVYLLAFLAIFAIGYWVGRQHYHFELQHAVDIQALQKVFEE